MILPIIILLFVFLLGSFLVLVFLTQKYIISFQEINHIHFALVLGAGLEKDNRPSDILMDRVQAAVFLYQNHKVDCLIMSGAARKGMAETSAMSAAAVACGVPQIAILEDNRGFSTFESCCNVLRNQAPSELIIVSQAFHLPRAIFLQRLLGIPAFGFTASIYHFSLWKTAYWTIREIFALPFNLLKFLIYLLKR